MPGPECRRPVSHAGRDGTPRILVVEALGRDYFSSPPPSSVHPRHIDMVLKLVGGGGRAGGTKAGPLVTELRSQRSSAR